MGFCFDMAGRLCCDKCGKSGGVRKIKCPIGWCQPYASCSSCKAYFKAKDHSGCAESSAAYLAKCKARLAEIDAGNAPAIAFMRDNLAAQIARMESRAA